MAIRYFFMLAFMVLIIIIQHFVYPTIAWSADEFHLRLSSPIDDSPLKPTEAQHSSSERVTVLERRQISGQVPRQRSSELSSQHLVIIGLDKNGQELDRVVVLDPRLIRAEIFDASGDIVSNKLFYRKDVEFSFVFPEDQRLSSLKFYHSIWTGKKFALELIGETQLTSD